MKIAQICLYSYPSKCGVWNNVYNISRGLIKKDHEVHVFSTNIIKGQEKESKSFEIFEKIIFHRYEPKRKIGKNLMLWPKSLKKEIISFSPDMIHVHVYRHPHTNIGLKVAKKLKIPCVLTTHAPFVEFKNRGVLAALIERFYDRFFGKFILNSFSKVIFIAKWELLILLKKIKCKKEKLIYIPNGVKKEFFKIKTKDKKKPVIFYLGRVAPVKNLNVFYELSKNFPTRKFVIYGPLEKEYHLKLNKNIKFTNKIYDLKKELELLRKYDVYLLPSLREGLPQTLLEAMASGKLVISSKTLGAKELITEGKNGFLFKNFKELKEILDDVTKNFSKTKKIREQARKTAKKFLWDGIVNKTENLYLTLKR